MNCRFLGRDHQETYASGQIKWEQIGLPSQFRNTGVELTNTGLSPKYAEICGGVGFTVEKPEQIRPALQQGDGPRGKKPSIVEVVVDSL